jgi:hypothetical protein
MNLKIMVHMVTNATNTESPMEYEMVMFLAAVCEYCCHSSTAIVRQVQLKHGCRAAVAVQPVK